MKQIRRILAILGIVLLVSMYLITLFCAVFDTGNDMAMFKASVTCTILVPILIPLFTDWPKAGRKRSCRRRCGRWKKKKISNNSTYCQILFPQNQKVHGQIKSDKT